MTDLDYLPEPEILASEIVGNLQSALAQFDSVSGSSAERSPWEDAVIAANIQPCVLMTMNSTEPVPPEYC